MQRSVWAWCMVGLAVWVVGCGPPARGAVTADGYQHSEYAYRILPAPGGGLLGESWKLDNFYEAPSSGTRTVLKPKDGPAYVTEYSLDADGDGNYETSAEELIYDIRFEHLVHDGVIFLRTIPISADLKQKKLSVLMDRYVEQIAGAGYEVVSLNDSARLLVEKRYAAAAIAKGKAELAEREAYVAVLDVANLDQIKVDPNSRRERVEVVILHTDFVYKERKLDATAKPAEFPVLMFAGYANLPDEFAAGLEEFHDFLTRIQIDGKRGFDAPDLTSNAPQEGGTPPDPTEPASDELKADPYKTEPDTEPTSEPPADPGARAPEAAE